MINAMNQPISDSLEINRELQQKTKSIHYSVVLDPDLLRDNPVEAKHRRLVRSHRNGPLDRDLKPNPKIRDELNVNCTSELWNNRNTKYITHIRALCHTHPLKH
jgi:phosphatidylinositol 3-kinase